MRLDRIGPKYELTHLMTQWVKKFILGVWAVLLLLGGFSALGAETDQALVAEREKHFAQWRQERDEFFKTHQRSPLTPEEKKKFQCLHYYPFDPKYIFVGEIERYVFDHNDPKHDATFLTNKGTNKRYIRYGKCHFQMDGKKLAIEVYKSLLSDALFIPFKDKTNGNETYEGGRYIDAEILPGYKMILDFNTAYFPICAYNDQLVCILPPKENMFDIEIRAGERNAH
jgi:uncharacterized protein (DUF1684 family)